MTLSILQEAYLEVLPYTGKSGCYSAMVPDNHTKKFFTNVAKVFGLAPDPESFHVTVMFSKEKVLDVEPESIIDTVPKVIVTRFVEVESWIDHKDRKIIVVKIDRESGLQEIHNTLLDGGAKHSFDDYQSHVTLGKVDKDFEITEQMKQKVQSLVENQPMLVFKDFFIGDVD